MTSHYQYYKDQLKQFDMEAQEIQQEIDRLYAQLAKVQAARLQFQAMNERVFGEPQQSVVMQDMTVRQGFLDRRIEEAKQLQAPPTPDDAAPESYRHKYGVTPKEKDDHKAYRKHKAKQKRSSPLAPEGWTMKALAYLREQTEPRTLTQIANAFGVNTDPDEKSHLRSALGRLKKIGLIGNPPGEPQGTGYTASYYLTSSGNRRIANGNGTHAHA